MAVVGGRAADTRMQRLVADRRPGSFFEIDEGQFLASTAISHSGNT